MKNIESPLSSYLLTDFYLAAFLISSGMGLLRTERTASGRMSFALQDTPERERLIQDFYAHKATVDPLKYRNAISDLKSIIHRMRDGC